MKKAVFREPDREGLSEAGLTGVDMHFHTDRSADSLAHIPLLLKRAKKLEIGVAVTDHNEVSGALKCLSAKNVLVVPGVELTSNEGAHTILYFSTKRECEEWARKVLNPLKKKNPFRLPTTTLEIYESAKRYNALICAPHPFGIGITGVHKGKITRKMEKMIDVVEGINAYVTRSMNKQAVAWAERINKPAVAGSDGHVVKELGQALTFGYAHNLHEFLDEVKRGHCIAMGKENSLYEKTTLGLIKEEVFLAHAHHAHATMHLLHDQLGVEFSYLKKRVLDGFHHHFRGHHGK